MNIIFKYLLRSFSILITNCLYTENVTVTKKKKIFQSVLTTEIVPHNFVMKGNVVRLSLGGSIPVCFLRRLE